LDTNTCSHWYRRNLDAEGSCPPGAANFVAIRSIAIPTDGEPPLHPRRDQPMFIPRVSYGQQRLVSLLAAHGARCSVASLYFTQANPELALMPSAAGLGLVLDPSTHLRERPPAERAPSFRAHRWGDGPDAFDPDRSSISESELEELSIGPLELQRGRGATLMLTSYQVPGPCGTRGRDLELMCARAGIAHFRSERMDEPPEHAAVATRREIYATLAARIEDLLSPRVRHSLADAYLGLGADGVWVKLLGFHEAADRQCQRAGGAFLRELADGPIPVVSDGAGQLHLGLLTCGVSASIGIGDSERFRYPTPWKQATQDSRSKGRTRFAYHASFMRSFKLGSDTARRAFALSRCRCGEHPPAQAPTNAQVGEHAAVVRMRDAATAADGTTADRREWLLALATKSTWLEGDADLRPGNMLEALRALYAGWDERPESFAVG